MLSIAKGSTSVLRRVFIQDATATDGSGLAGLTYASSGLTCYMMRDDDGNAAATAITLVTATRGTWTSGGFVEKDATNAPGWYEFGIPNAALATGSRSVDIHFKGATDMAPLPLEIELTGWNNQDAVHGGMSALPNAAAEASGGLYTRGTGAGQIKQTNNGEIDANATHVNNVATTSVTVVAANVGTTQPVNFTGTGASALVKGDAVDIAGAAVSTTVAQIGVNVVNVGGTVQTAGDIIGDTNDLQARLPAALTAGGNMRTETLYQNGRVWLDTGSGAAGTTNYVNGTFVNPNSSMANARTIANSLNITQFQIRNGSTITLDQGYTNFSFFGERWNLALASRAIPGSHFAGANVSGLSSGTGTEWDDCTIGAATIANDSTFYACGLLGTLTLQAAGSYVFDACFSATTGGTDAIVDFGALGATTVAFRDYAGGVEVRNMAAGDVLTFVGGGRVTIAASCTAGTVLISGPVNLVNNGSGQTITDTARWNEDQNITNVTGNVTGNVGGNVTGTVASVVGNVGGNVTGSVGSVVGAVGSVTGAVGSVTGNIGGNVVGTVASVTGNLGGNVVGNVNGNVVGSVGSVVGAVTVGTNNDKTSYALTAAYDPAKTAAQAGDAMALTSAERDATADAALIRDWTAVAVPAARSTLNALRFSRNKFVITPTGPGTGTITVYRENDSTVAWTGTVALTASDPVTSIDPA